jgi:hypothetical protein
MGFGAILIMRKRMLVVIAICLIVLVGVSFYTWSALHPQFSPSYQRTVNRNFESSYEAQAISEAESLNYTAITSKERFDNDSDPQAYLNPIPYLSYVCSNFVDSEALNYYETRYVNQQGKETPKYIELNYSANASYCSELRIYNSLPPPNVTWHNTTIVISTLNGTTTSGAMQFFYKNQSSYQTIEWGYDFNFSDCYLVKMRLEYSEVYAPLAAFFASVDQIVVLDRNFEPLLVGLESSMAVA